MEAPEKIYIDTNDNLSDSILYAFTEKDKDDDIEYVHKDAFIEKAEIWLKEHVLEYTSELNFGVGKTDPDYYTKHFIEDFKNYMKGE